MADSKSGGMAQAQKEKIDNKLLKINEQWINDVKARVEEGKIPNDVGDNLINKINTNIWRIKSGKAPIIDNIEFLKGNTEEGESEIKIKITFNKATQKTQMEELKKIIEDLNVSRDAQQMGTITYDEKNNTIELFRIPPLQKIEVELEVAKQEVPISTSTVPVEEIQKSTETIINNIEQMQKIADEMEKKSKERSWWGSLKIVANHIMESIKNDVIGLYKKPLAQKAYESRIEEVLQNLVAMKEELKKINEDLNRKLQEEKEENKKKIEKLVEQQQKLINDINDLKEKLNNLKPKPQPGPKPTPAPSSEPVPQPQPIPSFENYKELNEKSAKEISKLINENSSISYNIPNIEVGGFISLVNFKKLSDDLSDFFKKKVKKDVNSNIQGISFAFYKSDGKKTSIKLAYDPAKNGLYVVSK